MWDKKHIAKIHFVLKKYTGTISKCIPKYKRNQGKENSMCSILCVLKWPSEQCSYRHQCLAKEEHAFYNECEVIFQGKTIFNRVLLFIETNYERGFH